MNVMRIPLAIVLVLFASVFLFVGFARAQEVRSSTAVTVPKDTILDKTALFAGQDIVVDGTINGDLFCAGQNVTVNGTINGDVFCAGQNFTLNGLVNGSARLAGQNLTINGKVTGNISMAGSTLSISEKGVAGQDVQATGASLIVRGVITRDLATSSQDVVISGVVGRDARIKDESIEITDTAKIGGNLYYQSTAQAQIAPGVVAGTTTQTQPPAQKPVNTAKAFVLGYGYWFAAMLLIAFVVLLLFPRVLDNSVKEANARPGRTIFNGFFAVFLPPVLIVMLCLTLIGIPLAVLLSLIYMIALFMCGPFFAFFVGSKILPEQRAWVRMLLGSSIILIAYALPLVGFLVGFAAVVFGIGMFTEIVMQRLPKELKTTKS